MEVVGSEFDEEEREGETVEVAEEGERRVDVEAIGEVESIGGGGSASRATTALSIGLSKKLISGMYHYRKSLTLLNEIVVRRS
jgi:hypothetical protein